MRYKIRSQYNPDGRPSQAFRRLQTLGTPVGASAPAAMASTGAPVPGTAGLSGFTAGGQPRGPDTPDATGYMSRYDPSVTFPPTISWFGGARFFNPNLNKYMVNSRDGTRVVTDTPIRNEQEAQQALNTAAKPAAPTGGTTPAVVNNPAGPKDQFGRSAEERAKVIADIYRWFLGRDASPQEMAGYQGMSNAQILRAVQSSQEAGNYISAGGQPGSGQPAAAAAPGGASASGGASAGGATAAVRGSTPITGNPGAGGGFTPGPGVAASVGGPKGLAQQTMEPGTTEEGNIDATAGGGVETPETPAAAPEVVTPAPGTAIPDAGVVEAPTAQPTGFEQPTPDAGVVQPVAATQTATPTAQPMILTDSQGNQYLFDPSTGQTMAYSGATAPTAPQAPSTSYATPVVEQGTLSQPAPIISQLPETGTAPGEMTYDEWLAAGRPNLTGAPIDPAYLGGEITPMPPLEPVYYDPNASIQG